MTTDIISCNKIGKIKLKYGRYITWIYRCCQSYATSELTVHFAIDLFMKYKEAIGKRKLTFASILVASKWCDDLAIHSSHLEEYYSYHGYSGRQIAEVEWWLLCKIEYTFHSRQYESLTSAVFRIYPNGSTALLELSSYLLMLSYCLSYSQNKNELELHPYQFVITARRLLAAGRIKSVINESQNNINVINATDEYQEILYDSQPCTANNSPNTENIDELTPLSNTGTSSSISTGEMSSGEMSSSEMSSSEMSTNGILDTRYYKPTYPDFDVQYCGLPSYIMDCLQRVHLQYKKDTKFDFAFIN